MHLPGIMFFLLVVAYTLTFSESSTIKPENTTKPSVMCCKNDKCVLFPTPHECEDSVNKSSSNVNRTLIAIPLKDWLAEYGTKSKRIADRKWLIQFVANLLESFLNLPHHSVKAFATIVGLGALIMNDIQEVLEQVLKWRADQAQGLNNSTGKWNIDSKNLTEKFITNAKGFAALMQLIS